MGNTNKLIVTSISVIKNWFTTGAKPIQAQFWAVFDSYRHKSEAIPMQEVLGLNDTLANKADVSTVNLKANKDATGLSDNNILSWKEALGIADLNTDDNFFVSVTKTELDDLISGKSLIKGALYEITDADINLFGGTKIYLKALTINSLERKGYGEFYNPNYDLTKNDYGIYSIWRNFEEFIENSNIIYNENDIVFWGGLAYRKNTNNQEDVNSGELKSPFGQGTEDLSSAFYDKLNYLNENNEINPNYVKVIDSIEYDYENDHIIERVDKFNNIVRVDFDICQQFNNAQGIPKKPIAMFQWGNKNVSGNNVLNSFLDTVSFIGKEFKDNKIKNTCFYYNIFGFDSVFNGNSIENNLFNFDEQDCFIFHKIIDGNIIKNNIFRNPQINGWFYGTKILYFADNEIFKTSALDISNAGNVRFENNKITNDSFIRMNNGVSGKTYIDCVRNIFDNCQIANSVFGSIDAQFEMTNNSMKNTTIYGFGFSTLGNEGSISGNDLKNYSGLYNYTNTIDPLPEFEYNLPNRKTIDENIKIIGNKSMLNNSDKIKINGINNGFNEFTYERQGTLISLFLDKLWSFGSGETSIKVFRKLYNSGLHTYTEEDFVYNDEPLLLSTFDMSSPTFFEEELMMEIDNTGYLISPIKTVINNHFNLYYEINKIN